MGEDKKVISAMFGENPGQDISSMLKDKDVSGKDIKNILDSLRADYKTETLTRMIISGLPF
jgi:hypothetical protein